MFLTGLADDRLSLSLVPAQGQRQQVVLEQSGLVHLARDSTKGTPMKALTLASAVWIGLLTSGATWADTDCHVPVASWQPREVLRQQLEQQGWQVQRIKVDDGCYEVRGVDAQGQQFKAKYTPDTLLLLKMKTKEAHEGEQRRERSRGTK